MKSGVPETSSRVCAASRHVVHTQRLLWCHMDHSLRCIPGVCQIKSSKSNLLKQCYYVFKMYIRLIYWVFHIKYRQCRCFMDHISLFFSVPGRTFPTHPYFQAQLGAGQLSLYNILKAYSLLDPEVSFNSDFLSLSLSFCCNSLFPTRWNWQLSILGLRFFPSFLACAGAKFVIVVIVGGLLPGPVLHRWSAAVTHGGRGRLQHAQISNVWRGPPQTVQTRHDYPAGTWSLFVAHIWILYYIKITESVAVAYSP